MSSGMLGRMSVEDAEALGAVGSGCPSVVDRPPVLACLGVPHGLLRLLVPFVVRGWLVMRDPMRVV